MTLLPGFGNAMDGLAAPCVPSVDLAGNEFMYCEMHLGSQYIDPGARQGLAPTGTQPACEKTWNTQYLM
jgi:hypothetical protein